MTKNTKQPTKNVGMSTTKKKTLNEKPAKYYSFGNDVVRGTCFTSFFVFVFFYIGAAPDVNSTSINAVVVVRRFSLYLNL